MIEKGKIGVHQFTVLTALFTVGSSILIVPSGMALEAKQDAWIAAALGLVSGLLLVLLYSGISSRYPNLTLMQCCQALLGKWLGGTVSFLYFCFFFLLSALVLRNIGDFITTQVLPHTPIQLIHMLFLAVMIMGLRNGLETIARTAEIMFPWVILFFALMAVLLPPQFDIGNLKPVFGYGIKPIVRAAVPVVGTPYMESVAFLMVVPFVSNAAKSRKAFLVGVTIGGVMLIVISLLSILVLGPEVTSRHLYPSYSLAKKISIGAFLERIEVFMAGIWFITIYFKLAVCFYASTMTFAELFRMKESRQLYLPFGMIMIVLSIVAYPDASYFMNFASKVYYVYALPYGVAFPLLLLIVAIFKTKRQRTR